MIASILPSTLEHVDNPRAFVSSCAACLGNSAAASSSLFLSTINRTTKSYALAILGAEYILGIIPRKTHDWAKFRTVSEISDDIRSCGLEIALVQGLVPSAVRHGVGLQTLQHTILSK